MPHDLSIRAATKDDLPSLQALYEHLNPGDAAPDLEEAADILERFARYDGSEVLMGFCEGRAAASCTLVVIPNLTRGGAPYALVENVVTDPQYRKRGFGKALLTEALNRAWAQGCYKVMLLTGSKRPSTLAFYGDAGFEQSKTGFQARRLPPRED